MPRYSPIRILLDYVAQSPFRVAPEGAADLQHEVDNERISLEYVEDDPTGVIPKVLAEYIPERKVVRIGSGFLEALWAAVHLYLVIFESYRTAQEAGSGVFDLASDKLTLYAYRLYIDRLSSLGSHEPSEWPKTAIRPIRYPYRHSVGYASNELFLVAIGWVIHHELAHARLKHTDDAIDSMKQEHEADTEATRKVCTASATPEERTKRTLGIAAAVLLLIARDIRGHRRVFSTHPPTYERLLNTLAVAGLDQDHPTYAVAFVILDIILTEGNLGDRVDRSCKPFSDLCFEACMVLRELSVVLT